MKRLNQSLSTIALVNFILFTLVFTSCSKNPHACFTVSNDNPYTGEEVIFYNCSTDANSYVWDFGDGFSSGDDTAKHIYTVPGNYTASLLALAGSADSHFVTMAILVEDPTDTGKVVFWRTVVAPFDCPQIEITMTNVPTGLISSGILSDTLTFAPDCDNPAALTFDLITGITYGWQVKNLQSGYSETRPAFTIEKDGCLKLRAD